MNTEIAKAFLPCRRNYIRWCWCLSSAICLMAWLTGQSGWAGVAAFNAFAVVLMLSVDLDA